MPEDEQPTLPELGDSIDKETFEQILEMDDDEEEREFSRSIVYGFFDQVIGTFGEIDQAIQEKDFEKLSSLGHFLKGSSATLGLNHMKTACEHIQHLGKLTDETGLNEPPGCSTRSQKESWCMTEIKKEVKGLKEENTKIEKVLRRFFGEKV